MSKGSNRRKEDIKKIWNNWDEINWQSKKEEPFYPCYICGSEENKPTDFKKFCSRCGNKP
jgi:hypothetical protein